MRKNIEIEKKETRKFIVTLLIVVVLFVFSRYTYSLNFVNGNSMKGTVGNGGVVVANHINKKIDRYDIVLAKTKRFNSEGEQIAIKRVIAIPNDTVIISNGTIIVNGKPIEEYNYKTDDCGMYFEEIKLSKNEYLLIGDNRQESYDSRFYGAVEKEKIIGKVEYILFKGEKK